MKNTEWPKNSTRNKKICLRPENKLLLMKQELFNTYSECTKMLSEMIMTHAIEFKIIKMITNFQTPSLLEKLIHLKD